MPRLLVVLALLAAAAPAAAAESWHARCEAALAAMAVKPCEEALIDNPQDTLALKRLADIYLGNYGEWHAIELYTKRILLEPDNPEAYFDQAAAFATMWYFAEASPSMHRALELEPGSMQAQRLASIVFEQTGEMEAAFAAHRALAEAGIDTGMYDLARDFHYGHGTKPDRATALAWYERAATAGHVAAMRALAENLGSGALGVTDPARATYWHQQVEAIRQSFGD